MKLSDLKKDSIFKIVDFDGCESLKDRLSAMNIKKGTIARVVNKGLFGPIEIDIDGNKIAIGKRMAKKIEVKELNCPAVFEG